MKTEFGIIVIGGSAGSLEPVLTILEALKPSRFAIVLILHRKPSNDSVLAKVLSGRSAYPVREAEEKEKLQAGVVYVAPADYHLLFEKDGTISLDDSEKVNFSRPSIDVSFDSAADAYGSRLIGILLSGGNTDGAKGMKKIKREGGYCIVQDPNSATVAVMPGHAINETEVNQILNAGEIAGLLNRL
ncbi:MAG TPA: chemotaxis protein CheB [Flavitalea sp.]|nr:chemotaxis protein CheB [Flavitalea sp.]